MFIALDKQRCYGGEKLHIFPSKRQDTPYCLLAQGAMCGVLFCLIQRGLPILFQLTEIITFSYSSRISLMSLYTSARLPSLAFKLM